VNISKLLTVRFFVIASLLLSGLILNGIMMVREDVAQSRHVVVRKAMVSRLKRLQYTKGNRARNISEIGAGSSVTKSVISRIERYDSLYRVSNPHPLVARGLKTEGIPTDEGRRFCRAKTKEADPAYRVFPLLVELTDDTKINVLKITDLSKGISVVHPTMDLDIDEIYQKMEQSDFGGRPDKPCVAISLMLLGKSGDVQYSEYSDNPKDIMMPPTCEFLLEKYDGLKSKLVTYLANFHYVAELAQDSKNKICYD
jgi:hypothetical protein